MHFGLVSHLSGVNSDDRLTMNEMSASGELSTINHIQFVWRNDERADLLEPFTVDIFS